LSNIGATSATAAELGLRSARQLGSGTTLIAAERAGRMGDPALRDVALHRMCAVCDLEAVLEPTGERFEEVAQARAEEPELAPN
jgi:hypothetical protein